MTGTAWWYLDKFVRVKGVFGEDHHPAQEILIRIHGSVAYFTLLVIGYLIHSHIRPGLKHKKKRSLKTGWILIIATGLLILSSAMDLFGPEGVLHSTLVQIHRFLGLVFPAILAIHLIDRALTASQEGDPHYRHGHGQGHGHHYGAGHHPHRHH